MEAIVWPGESEDNFVGIDSLFSPIFTWLWGIELMSPGLHDKCLLSHFAGLWSLICFLSMVS